MISAKGCLFYRIDPNAATSAGLEAISGSPLHYEDRFSNRMLRIHLIMSRKACGTLHALIKRKERNHGMRGSRQTGIPDLVLFDDPITGTTLALVPVGETANSRRGSSKNARSKASFVKYGCLAL